MDVQRCSCLKLQFIYCFQLPGLNRLERVTGTAARGTIRGTDGLVRACAAISPSVVGLKDLDGTSSSAIDPTKYT